MTRRMTPNELFRARFGRDLPEWDERSPNYDYGAKLAKRKAAMRNHARYLAECKRRYPGGSLSK